MSEPVLELRSISKNFGANQALDDINPTVEHGSLIVLLGPSRCWQDDYLADCQ